MKTDHLLTGSVNCLRLHIYSKPDLNSEVICKIRYLTEVKVDMSNSTEDFYKIHTAIGAEGFCERYLININNKEV